MITESRTGTVLIGILSILLFAVPFISDAYFTTSQQAFSITNQTALFAVTYEFGRENDEMRLPIAALRNLGHGSDENAVGYEILRDGRERADEGAAVGLVLSNAPIEDGGYIIPAGESREFMLFVLFTVPETGPEAGYVLQATNLPFAFDEMEQWLNESELQYYVTPETELNDR